MAAPTLSGHGFSDHESLSRQLIELTEIIELGRNVDDPNGDLAKQLAARSQKLGPILVPPGYLFVVKPNDQTRFSALTGAASDGNYVEGIWTPTNLRGDGLVASHTIAAIGEPMTNLHPMNATIMRFTRCIFDLVYPAPTRPGGVETVGIRAHLNSDAVRKISTMSIVEFTRASTERHPLFHPDADF